MEKYTTAWAQMMRDKVNRLKMESHGEIKCKTSTVNPLFDLTVFPDEMAINTAWEPIGYVVFENPCEDEEIMLRAMAFEALLPVFFPEIND